MEHPRKVKYRSWTDIVCPTCHGAGQSRVAFSPGNVAKTIITLPLWIVLGSDLLLIRLRRRCRACGASFIPKRSMKKTDPICWNCGYNIRGLNEPRCPECGTRFPPFVIDSPRGNP